MEKFICIHGHFYQPPRENAWLEAVELQDSAYPYHDWNERIAAECYAPNATARMLDEEGRIVEITSNYSRISFNFGPTLLSWMKERIPDIHDAIVAADLNSRERFSGHGSAMAQSYNHMILPLAGRRDKYTQILWGIRDFESRFGRRPEGMWLAETAVDAETLDIMAELGIKFTVLSPFQASKAREIGVKHWRDVNGAKIDPTRAYLARLPSKRTINLFFYDAPVSQAVAFEGLLNSGERLAERLTTAFNDKRTWNQLVHIATDGESYGHHHRAGEMALAYALHYIEKKGLARLTNYGEFLEKNPPTHEVQIHEKSAWSCSHGVERWASNCGCNSGGRAGWNQLWRTPLRQALDWLRDELAPLYQQKGSEFFKDPWEARNNYIHVILDRSEEGIQRFLSTQSRRDLDENQQTQALKLMELQRHAMLMYTSCGWFFDEVSGIETVQVIQYAARAIQLAHELFDKDLEPQFLERLQHAKSNIPEHGDGRAIYQKFVKPAMVDWEKVVAHYAISSMFENYPEQTRIYLYTFDREDHQVQTAGRVRLAIGRTRARFDVTREAALFSYAALHWGDHSINGGVRPFRGPDAYEEMQNELKEAFIRADFPEILRAMDRHFGESCYSLKTLFKDEQRKVLNEILTSTHEDLENRYRMIMDRYTPLLLFLQDLRAPIPEVLRQAATLILNIDLLREFKTETPEPERIRQLVQQGKDQNLPLQVDALGFSIKNKLEEMMQQFASQPGRLELLIQIQGIAALLSSLPLEVNLWKIQNLYFEMLRHVRPHNQAKALEGEATARDWLDHFDKLGDHLRFRLQQRLPDAF